MAFGDFLGAFTNSNTSIPAGPACSGSVAISVGDLIVAVLAQQTALTVSACGDNLNGASSYTAQNAGTLSSATISGRMFWRVSTVAGTLTTVTFVATSSTNNASWGAAIFKGPFNTIDANPANVTDDLTTPYAGNATGTRTLNISLIVGWAARNAAAGWTASTPGTNRVDVASAALANAIIQAWPVYDSVATLTPSWTGTAPTRDVLGTASFLPVVDTLLGRGAM